MNTRIRQSVERMAGYVPGEQPREPDIIKLNTNENPYPPAPGVMAALRRAEPDWLRMYPDPVCHRLRAQIADLHGVAPEQVCVTNGSDEVLALCARALVERNGTIGWFDPSYSLYPVLAQIEDIQTRPVPLTADFAWAMPEGYTADLFYLTQPNAPTSRSYDRAQVEAFCAAFPGVVLIDEAYVDFASADCMDLARHRPNVLVARTLSKSFSLAGLRLGYAVGPADLIGALMKIKDSYNVSRLAQELASAALDEIDTMRATVARIVATRERVREALRVRGYEAAPSETNFLWVRPPAGLAAETLFKALRERKIYVRYFPGPVTGAHLRITVGTDPQMDALLAALPASPTARE